ncbi:hypothetical protein ACFLRX_08200 [Acidobacteriota bacterium]
MKVFAVAAVIFLIIFTPGNAQEQKYSDESVVHLSFLTGNVFIQKAADIEYEEGIVNMPILEGDRVGTTDGRAEIYLGRGNYIRLDINTKIDFERFPKQDDRLFQFQVWSGNIYLSIRDLENEKDIEIHSSDVSVYLLDKGLYRIDVRTDAETEIFVFTGLVEAAGESGSVLIKDEQRLEAAEGYFTSHPTNFFAASHDSFDRWSENRDSQIKQHLAIQNTQKDLDLFWDHYNYDRWYWNPLNSWYGFPGPGWGSWYWRPDYFGWSYMNYWGYPGYIFSNRYYGSYRDREYPYNPGALTVIRKNQLKARNIYKVSLSQDSTQNPEKFKLDNQKSLFTPTRSSVGIQKLDQSNFFLMKKVSSADLRQGKITIPPTSKQLMRENIERSTKSALKTFKSYPSSSAITAKKSSSSKSSKKPSSAISRIYRQISKRSGSVSQGRSRSSSSRSTVSRSGSGSSRSTSSRSTSSKSSSSKSRSTSSSRVKKIKK